MTITKTRPAGKGKARRARTATVPAGAISRPFDATVDVARQCDALSAAHAAGVLTKAEYQAKLKPLTAKLHAAAKADEERMGALGPLGVTIGTTVVVTGEPIETAWGNQVRADLLALNAGKLELSGGVLTGNLGGTTASFSGNVSADTATGASHLMRKDQTDTLLAAKASLTGATFTGQINGTTASFSGNVAADTATGASHLMRKDQTDAALALKASLSGATFTGALKTDASTGLLVGKASSGITVVGSELFPSGVAFLTADTNALNLIINKTSAAIVSGAVFESFRLTNGEIGSITRSGATSAVLFVTTSDSRLKVDKGPMRDALKLLAKRAPHLATWKDAKTAGAELMWFADEWADIPGVTVGRPGARFTARSVKARGWGKVGDPEPMQMDYGRTTPLLGAALLELAERVAKLERAA